MTTSLSSLLGVTPIAGTLPVAYGGTGLTAPGTTGNLLTSNGSTWVSQPAPISLPTQTSNSGKYLTTDGTNASWATVVGGLVSTPTKTANYTAASNDLVRVNATSSFTITMPASPADGAIVGIMDIANTFSTNNITVAPGAGATIEGDTSVILDISHTYAEFIYSTSTLNWLLKDTPSNESILPEQTGNSGKYLTTDGTVASWQIVSALPTQTGNTGKYLTTDGTNASWGGTTGSGNVVLSTSPTLVTPTLGTPASGDLSNATNAVGYSLKSATTTINISSATAPTTGQVLTATSGTAATWQTVNGLPTQTGNSGKYLTTDGTTASWGTVGGGGVTLSDDTSTTNTSYLTMARNTSGSASTVYTSSTKLYFNPSNGTLTATNFNTLSDQNKKTNIKPVESGLSIVNQLKGVEFDFKDSGQHSSGVIAQEIEKVLPFLVTESEGTKTVNYSGIIAYLISSINELEQRLKAVEG